MSDSRKADDWANHFQCIQNNGIQAIYLVSDDATGIRAAHNRVFGDLIRQSDTYHAIAHQLGEWPNRLERSAYQALEAEQDCLKKLDTATTDAKREAILAKYNKARDAAEVACILYDDFCYVYRCVIKELNVFDCNGNVRNRQQAQDGVAAGLTLIDELCPGKFTKEINKAKRTFPDLFPYFDVAQDIIHECKNELGIDEETLKVYCCAWQWGRAARKAKDSQQRSDAQENQQFCLEIAAGLQQDDANNKEDIDLQEQVYRRLDEIVQSSAIVECINSIIRPYLNTTKNHVTQELLNLVMFYHNHHRYIDGHRAGKTPMEILTGERQTEDWMSSLLDHIEEKDPDLLDPSILT